MPVTFKGHATAAATSVTLPAHVPGDLIVICAARTSTSTTPPTAPSASGTVPTWTTITSNTGSTSNYLSINWYASVRTAYTVATASNHTSGTWTNAGYVTAVVFNGAKTSSPIGANSETGGTTTSPTLSIAPSITLQNTTASSGILHFLINAIQSPGSGVGWGTTPSGYTRRSGSDDGIGTYTKDTTTSDGSLTLNTANSYNGTMPYRGASIELLATPTGQFFPFLR